MFVYVVRNEIKVLPLTAVNRTINFGAFSRVMKFCTSMPLCAITTNSRFLVTNLKTDGDVRVLLPPIHFTRIYVSTGERKINPYNDENTVGRQVQLYRLVIRSLNFPRECAPKMTNTGIYGVERREKYPRESIYERRKKG